MKMPNYLLFSSRKYLFSHPCAPKFVVLMLVKELASIDTNSYLVDGVFDVCPTENRAKVVTRTRIKFLTTNISLPGLENVLKLIEATY